MYWKTIDVRPQHHGLARLASVEQCDDSRLGGTRFDLETKLAQSVGELAARLMLGEAHLGMAVKMSPELDHLVED